MARKPGRIRIGIGGWTYEPWRGPFYPEGLPHKQELQFASRTLDTIEINGTYYSRFKPDSWRRWHDETPDGFIFSVKASRHCTNRKVLAGAGEAIGNFISQGLSELGPKLGPIVWQFMPTKVFDRDDTAAFIALLPREHGGWSLRHALEVRHPSFVTEAFMDLARAQGVAIVCDLGGEFPQIDIATADFSYARFLGTRARLAKGMTQAEIADCARRCREWASRGDVFAYVISGAKERNPAAARAIGAVLAERRKNKGPKQKARREARLS